MKDCAMSDGEFAPAVSAFVYAILKLPRIQYAAVNTARFPLPSYLFQVPPTGSLGAEFIQKVLKADKLGMIAEYSILTC